MGICLQLVPLWAGKGDGRQWSVMVTSAFPSYFLSPGKPALTKMARPPGYFEFLLDLQQGRWFDQVENCSENPALLGHRAFWGRQHLKGQFLIISMLTCSKAWR